MLATVVPKLRGIFDALGSDLPESTRVLLWLSDNWWLPALLLVPLALMLWHPSARSWLQRHSPWSYAIAGVVLVLLSAALIGAIAIGLFVSLFSLANLHP